MADEERVLKNIKYIIKQNYVDTEDDIIGILISASNLIKKQSKEIEELKDKCKELIFEKQELTSALLDSTPNDKIKAKIEELDYNDIGNFERRCKQEVLQSLLEKE